MHPATAVHVVVGDNANDGELCVGCWAFGSKLAEGITAMGKRLFSRSKRGISNSIPKIRIFNKMKIR